MTKHVWDWAEGAPEINVPNDKRVTSIVETCKLCGATTMRFHNGKNKLRYLQIKPIMTKQPICPSTCEMAILLTILCY